MRLPDDMKDKIGKIFYDKTLEVYALDEVEDEEGCIIRGERRQRKEVFKGNFQYMTREKLQQEYGEHIEAEAKVTCARTKAVEGDKIVYQGQEYLVHSVICYDSYVTILLKKDS